MGNWFKQFEALIWMATIALVSLIFVYQSFATKEYVDIKHEGVIDILKEIREDVRELRNKNK
jgi:hypothetical protein